MDYREFDRICALESKRLLLGSHFLEYSKHGRAYLSPDQDEAHYVHYSEAADMRQYVLARLNVPDAHTTELVRGGLFHGHSHSEPAAVSESRQVGTLWTVYRGGEPLRFGDEGPEYALLGAGPTAQRAKRTALVAAACDLANAVSLYPEFVRVPFSQLRAPALLYTWRHHYERIVQESCPRCGRHANTQLQQGDDIKVGLLRTATSPYPDLYSQQSLRPNNHTRRRLLQGYIDAVRELDKKSGTYALSEVRIVCLSCRAADITVQELSSFEPSHYDPRWPF